MWGTWALYHAPYAALEVHRRYIAADCDLISTTTWGIMAASEKQEQAMAGQGGLRHWLDVARLGVRLAREAVEENAGNRAVAFSLSMATSALLKTWTGCSCWEGHSRRTRPIWF